MSAAPRLSLQPKSNEMPHSHAFAALSPEPAELWKRFSAAVVDVFLLGICLSIFMKIVSGTAPWAELTRSKTEAVITIMFCVSLVLAGICWFLVHKGGTPGKLILQILVVDHHTGLNLTWKQALLREVVGKPIGITMLFYGIFLMMRRRDRRALHDIIGGSRVVKL